MLVKRILLFLRDIFLSCVSTDDMVSAVDMPVQEARQDTAMQAVASWCLSPSYKLHHPLLDFNAAISEDSALSLSSASVSYVLYVLYIYYVNKKMNELTRQHSEDISE